MGELQINSCIYKYKTNSYKLSYVEVAKNIV